MKYLAILKDSLREAIDTKVFYVTLAISSILILLVASVSFRPVAVEEQAQQITRQMNFFMRMLPPDKDGTPMVPNYQITGFEQTKPSPPAEPWNGDYRFNLEMQFTSDKHLDTAKKANTLMGKAQLAEMSREAFFRHRLVIIEDNKSDDPLVVRYPITLEGSKIDDPRDWVYEPSVLFVIPLPFLKTSLSGAVYWIEDKLVNGFGAWIGILAGVVITAFFIPNMLRKGTVDLLLAKPIQRTTLLIYKYVGGLAFVFLNTAFVVVGMWLALGLRSGIWAPAFLWTILIITFFFAILYAVSTFFAILTQSPIVSIMVTVVVWLLLFLVGTLNGFADSRRQMEEKKEMPAEERLSDRWWMKAIRGVHYVLPRTNDLDVLTTRLLSRQVLSEAEIEHRKLNKLPDITWGESLTVSGVFVTLLLALSCWRFAVRDY